MKKRTRITIFIMFAIGVVIIAIPVLFVGNIIFKINGGFECVGVENIPNPLFAEVFEDLHDRSYEKSFFGEKDDVLYTITNTRNKSQKKCIKIQNVDKDSFHVLNMFYAKDKNLGYFEDGNHMKNLSGPALVFDIDSNSFDVFDGKSAYAKDKNNVYYGGRIVNKADPQTFQITDDINHYGSDKNHKFSGDKIIEKN